MSTIKNFVEKVTKKGYMPATVEQQNEKLKKDLEVKSYLSIKDKRKLVEQIIDDTIIYDSGLFKFNGIDQLVYYNMRCIEAYTNLELSDDIEDDYDALVSSGLMNKILATFENEYTEVLSLLQMQCDYILMDNSVASKVNILLVSATNAINKLADAAEKSFKDIKPEDVQKITELISTMK
jgi:hypothetical protein